MQAFRAPARPRGARVPSFRRTRASGGRAGVMGLAVASYLAGGASQLTHRLHRPTGGKASPASANLTIRTAEGRQRRRPAPERRRSAGRSAPRSHALAQRRDDGGDGDAIHRLSGDRRGRRLAARAAGRMMREGDDDERVPVLRKRLQISGDLPRRAAPTAITPSTRSCRPAYAASSAATDCAPLAVSSSRPSPRST